MHGLAFVLNTNVLNVLEKVKLRTQGNMDTKQVFFLSGLLRSH